MQPIKGMALAALAACTLAACGGGSSGASVNTSTQAGTLINNPPLRIASLNAADLATQLGSTAAGVQLLALAGTPKCGIDFHYFQYQTVGAKGEQTTATGALMAPNGGAGCTGARPILLYTHGTAVTKGYNLANPQDTTNEAWSTAPGGSEGPIIAAMYAAQGYIVVAPNYAGYDTSPLPYHPYLVGDQQAQDVINSLTAARTAIKSGLPSGVSDSGRLFITGYSQGGYVAMATYRAMQAANMTVTAVSPMSGPYALEATGDASTLGEITLGAPIYYTMLANAYQNAYGNIYSVPTDTFTSTYATGIDTLIPSGTYTYSTLISAGKLPQFAIFSTTPTGNAAVDGLTTALTTANPLFALGFGSPHLLNDSVRLAYIADALADPDHGLSAVTPFMGLPPWSSFADVAVSSSAPAFGFRADLRKNDLRTSWFPTVPMLMCAGHDDPEVLFAANTGVMTRFWAPYINSAPFGAAPNNLVTVLDVDPDATTSGLQQTIATAAVTAFETDLAGGASAAKIAADVQAAVVVAFAAHFNITASGATPIDAQGVLVGALAGVAAQAVVTYYAAGVTDAATMGKDVLFAVTAYYHFPSTQIACEVAARGFFAAVP